MQFLEFTIMALATWQMVETWHHGSIFSHQRAKLELFDGFCARLLTCMFCLSHWVASCVVAWCAVSWVLLRVPGNEWIGYLMQTPIISLAVTRASQVGHDYLRAVTRQP